MDHDHAVERHCLSLDYSPEHAAWESVRGLLCRRCNKLLAMVADNANILRAAARYLDNPPAKEVLLGV